MAKMSFAQRVKQRAKEAEFSGGSDTLKMKDGVSFFKAKKGKNEIMVVPFEMDVATNADKVPVGDLWFRFPILKHYKIGPEDKSVICPKTIGKKCPICEHRAALLAQGRSTDDVEIRELATRKRELYYVIDLQDKEKDGALQVFECSYHNFGRKLEEELRDADDNSLAVNFADPDDGAVVVVRMAEESLGKNKYLEATRFDFEKRDKHENALVQEAMKDAAPFGGLLTILSYNELKNMFYDLTDEEAGEEEAEAEDKPAQRRAGSSRRQEEQKEDSGRRKAESAKQDEDEEDDEPAPRRRNQVKPSEDMSDDDDEDEPEPAPRKRKKVASDEDEDEPAPSRKSKAGKDDSPKCPGKGAFGEECDQLDECEDCEHWEKCRDLTDEFEAKRKKK